MKNLFLLFLLIPLLNFAQKPELTFAQAEKLIQLPLHCFETEFPNKLSQTLADATELATPKELHPVFYGCFDWHSAVHGYWTIVNLLKMYPELDSNYSIKNKLAQHITPEKIAIEIAYFQREHEYSYERTYGWTWLYKLQESLDSWDTEFGKRLSENLQPLTDLLVARNMEYLPKLNYPIRVGTHTNTAFGMSFAYDYAVSSNNSAFKNLIEARAKNFYLNDKDCPLSWEPNGYDFLSPCMEEVDLMRKILNETEFKNWVQDFTPSLVKTDFDWEVGIVSDRKDGHLVHLDGLNFSRAWVFYSLAKEYKSFEHLIPVAEKHFNYSYPNLVDDSYEGGHWLASFALYALLSAN